jgi:hypothetical protein
MNIVRDRVQNYFHINGICKYYVRTEMFGADGEQVQPGGEARRRPQLHRA